MSKPIQSINDISPLTEGDGKSKVLDPAQVEYDQGKRLLEKNETGPAAVALHNALVGFEEKNDEQGIANASNQLGNVCLKRGEYEKALVHYQRAEDICRKLGDPLSLVALAKQFILVYTESGKYNEAVNRSLDLLDLYRANNDPKGSVDIMDKMADIYIKSGDNDKAADVYRTIASIHKNFRHNKIAAGYIEKAEQLVGNG